MTLGDHKTTTDPIFWDEFLEIVNNSLKKIGFNYSVRIEEIKRNVFKQYVIKIIDGNNEYFLRESGDAILRILPIIFRLIHLNITNNNSGIIIIREPEAHVHPALQAEIAKIVKLSNFDFSPKIG